MVIELNDLIQIYDNILSKDICDSLISFFEENVDKQEKIDNNGCPTFTQINFTENHKKDKKIEELHKKVLSKVLEYKKKYYEYIDLRCFPEQNTFEQFRIKRYENNQNQFFDTHVDVKDYSSARRYLSFLFYLNDVDEGGETIFEGIKISPKCGRMIIFPPMWMFPHKGCIPKSNPKYIMSTYLHYK
jgi:hypothetical protein